MRTPERHGKERAVSAFAAVAVLLGVTAFARVAGFYVERGRMRGIASIARAESDPNELKQCLGEAKKAADALKEKNVFIKQPPKQHPVKQVAGILGKEVLIAGKWYEEGGKVGDATIVEIGPTLVTISWNGKETAFSPIGAKSTGPPRPPTVAKTPEKKDEAPAPEKPAAAEPVRVEAPAPVEEDPLAWLGVKLSPRMRAMLLEKWNSASDEEKAEAKEEWNKMSDEEKEKAIESMEQHM